MICIFLNNCQNYINYRKCVFEFPYNLIGQLSNGFSKRPNIACTQILIDSSRPRARISALARRRTLKGV